MLPTETDDCDDCVPAYLRNDGASIIFFSSLPFVLTFFIVAIAVLRKLFPILSGESHANEIQNGHLRTHTFDYKPAKAHTALKRRLKSPPLSALGLTQLTFATNIALSAVLVELLLCEISNALSTSARQLALRFTLPTLLILLVLVAPALEIWSILAAAGLSFNGTGKSWLRIAWLSEAIALTLWLLSFWYVGHGLLSLHLRDEDPSVRHGFIQGGLERVGVIGISLMACLSGFAALSAPWQLFGVRTRIVTDADIARKQAGLEATEDMLQSKRSRLRALERRISETATDKSLLGRVIGTFRGTSESQERSTLQLEISGLDTMRMSLNNSLYTLRTRHAAQLRAHTPMGRLINSFGYVFAVYCVYRLGTTTLSVLRRTLFPGHNFSSGTDPVTNIVALLTSHWNPTLNRAAWSRQISFLLSGFMLLASFNSALQTFLLLGRAFPSLLSALHANLALVVSQVSATYVISTALLLRSNLPRDVGSVISDALGAPLAPRKVDAWFEGWFLGAALLTGFGIWLGRKIKGNDFDDETYYGSGADPELGKMN